MSVESFRAISPSEFFYRNRELAGFSNPARALYQSVRELTENALDATDAHGILPEINISIDKSDSQGEDIYSITVQDNGIGIPPHYVPQAFGMVLFSSKYTLRQTRGMFGLGAKMVVLYGQITVGKPVEVITSPIKSNRIYGFRLMIDIKNNEPVVLERSSWRKESDWHGTVVKVSILGDWQRSKSKIIDYIKRTHIIAPYATIYFKDPEGKIYLFKRVTELIPKPPRETKPHPIGVDLEMLKMMLASTRRRTILEFLENDFQGVGRKTAENILAIAGLRSDRNPRRLSQEEIERLAESIKKYDGFRRPSADHLSPIGDEILKIGLSNMFKPEFVDAITRKPTSYAGHAVIVETGIAYGGSVPIANDPTEILLLRFANKIPLLYDEGSDVSFKIVSTLDWKDYEVEFPAPIAVLVHVCSTKIPYKGVGKESIADVPEIEAEIRNGLREVARRLRNYLSRKKREEEAARRAYSIIKYIPEISRSLSTIVGADSGESIIEEKLLSLARAKLGVSIKSVKDVVIGVE
ncbi:MAG: DNA topoisomerase VI subunit B [Desulfurococcaceae archaeon]|jgi:DNA topoisomerase-6 subunit B|nr:MAG: DNA topoisomerase VI subunit B [Desulfurococcaceae archaeon]